MSKFEIIGLGLVGIALGTGAFMLNQNAGNTRQIIEGLPMGAYEACMDSNAVYERFNMQDANVDCEAEYLD